MLAILLLADEIAQQVGCWWPKNRYVLSTAFVVSLGPHIRRYTLERSLALTTTLAGLWGHSGRRRRRRLNPDVGVGLGFGLGMR